MAATKYLYMESEVDAACSGQGLSAEPMEKSSFPTISPFHSAV